MKRPRRFLSSILIIATFGSFAFASQSLDNIQAAPLKGIKSLRVLVEALDKDAETRGLTFQQIKTATELRLRREGIQIADGGENDCPFIYVKINTLDRAYSINISINEWVVLTRDQSISCFAATWSAASIGTSSRPEYILNTGLGGLLDYFLNDYYKANPKK